MKRLQENGVKVYRTDENGEIEMAINQRNLIKIKLHISN